MKITRIAASGIALLAAGGLVLTGCTSGGGTAASTSGGDSESIILANGSEPQNPLIPTNTNEVGGGKILDSIFAGLVYYDADGAPVNDMAESITVDDPQNLTVVIKQGQTFTNGEVVTADSFIDAWNYGALQENQQLSNYFFEDIEGFEIGPGPDGESGTDDDIYGAQGPLSGLQKVDDYTFTIALNKPASDFALRLGYSAFFPLPSEAFDDIEAFGENPIGNGPYMLAEEGAWQHDVGIDLVVNPDYQGGRTPQNGGVRFEFYASQDAAYADLLGGNVDVIDAIPPASLATYESDLGDRAVNQPAAIFQSFTIPSRLAHFSGEEGALRRAAISQAIDRPTITDTVFQGTRTPAVDFTSPVIDGWSDDLEGADVLSYDADNAADLWAQANAIAPWDGSFQIAYNADGGHQQWVDAIANQLNNTLEGINASGAPYPTFAEVRTAITDRSIQTAFRTGWQADYPGLYNFLGPIYATNAGSNDGDYSNPDFDALLASGIGSTDPETANADFQSAQEILLQDLPAIPLWYSNVNGGYGANVENVQFGWNSVPLYYEITKSE